MPFLTQSLSMTDRVDSVFWFIFILCAAFLVGITAVMIFFVVKYNRKRHPVGVDIEGNMLLEITWTVIPLILFLLMFYFGWTNFAYMRNPPRDAMVVEVTGRQWAWSFKYPNGKQSEEMYAALDRPLRLELRSQDVVHGFYIAAFRVKQDVIPGRMTELWLSPTTLGTFDIQCTVICGVRHTYMLSKLHVVSEAEFKEWYFADENAPEPGTAAAAPAKAAPAGEPAPAVVAPAEAPPAAVPAAAVQPAPSDPARALLEAKGCLVCHSLDGTVKVGASFKGLFGKSETVVHDGQERVVTVDEAYLATAIREPGATTVKGHPPNMPVTALNEQETSAVVGYLKTLR